MFVDITKILQTAVLNSSNTMDFENIQTMDPKILHHRVGITHNAFEQVIRETPSLQQEVTDPNTAIAIFLMKLRTGESNERLSNESPYARKENEYCAKCLVQDFVPRHLGLDHISRNEVVAKNLSVPNGLFGNPDAPLQERKAILVIDGTYVYTQKSSNFLFQRKTYSLHKYTNLLKPFLIVCCDGYILDVTGLTQQQHRMPL
uniref:SFRICE_040660 n=1 Tax=Spodoptera frugiperda TaxID=7108 RepID=A0A2H1VNI0_SPOFR